jgi:hypothetical protein
MSRTGLLGSSQAALGDFTLGAGPNPAALVASTPGLSMFFRCDDPAGSSKAVEEFGRHATAVSAGSATATLSVAGIDGNSLKTPVATAAVSPPPYTKVVTPHISFDYTGATLAPGAAGTIECWVRFQEFGDPAVAGSPATPAAPYQFLALSQSTNSIVFRVADPASIDVAWKDSGGTTRTATFAPLNPGIANNLPAAELNRWYYLAFAWDATSVAGYCNGVPIFTSSQHPPSYTAANFSFGGAGAQYDLVSLVNRKLTKEEVANRMVAAGDSVATSDARVTTFFVNAVAGYAPSVRVTKLALETLRTGARQVRLSTVAVEVLRSVNAPVAVSASDTITFSDSASGGRGLAGSASDTITFGNLASAGKGVGATDQVTFSDSAGLSHAVNATDTITFSDVGHTQRIGVSATDTITFGDVAGFIGVHPVRATDTITFVDTAAPHNTIIRVGAVDHVVFSGDDFNPGGGTWNRPITDTLTITDRADARNTTIPVHATDGIVFSDQGGTPHTYEGTAVDQILFSDGATGGHGIMVSATDTITFGDSTPFYSHQPDTVTFGDVATAFQPHQRNADTLTVVDRADGRIVLPNPELGLSVVLRSGTSFEFPFCYCPTPEGMVLFGNGVDPMFRWTPSDKKVDTAGVAAPATAGTLAATPFVNVDAQGNVDRQPVIQILYPVRGRFRQLLRPEPRVGRHARPGAVRLLQRARLRRKRRWCGASSSATRPARPTPTTSRSTRPTSPPPRSRGRWTMRRSWPSRRRRSWRRTVRLIANVYGVPPSAQGMPGVTISAACSRPWTSNIRSETRSSRVVLLDVYWVSGHDGPRSWRAGPSGLWATRLLHDRWPWTWPRRPLT